MFLNIFLNFLFEPLLQVKCDLLFDLGKQRVYFPPVPPAAATSLKVHAKGGILAGLLLVKHKSREAILQVGYMSITSLGGILAGLLLVNHKSREAVLQVGYMSITSLGRHPCRLVICQSQV